MFLNTKFTYTGFILNRFSFLYLCGLLLLSCSPKKNPASETYTLPESYIGSFYILFAIENSKINPSDSTSRHYEIPKSGVLLVNMPANDGWLESSKIRFFYQGKADKHEILGRWSTSLEDTPLARSDQEIKIFGGGIGEYEGIYADCVIVYQNFYIGTNANRLDDVNYFSISDFIQSNPIDCDGMKQGTLQKSYLKSTSD